MLAWQCYLIANFVSIQIEDDWMFSRDLRWSCFCTGISCLAQILWCLCVAQTYKRQTTNLSCSY